MPDTVKDDVDYLRAEAEVADGDGCPKEAGRLREIAARTERRFRDGQESVIKLLRAELRKVTQGGGAVQITTMADLRGLPKHLTDIVARIIENVENEKLR